MTQYLPDLDDRSVKLHRFMAKKKNLRLIRNVDAHVLHMPRREAGSIESDDWGMPPSLTEAAAGRLFDALPSTTDDNVLSEAKRIVLQLRTRLPANTDIYSMDDGKVAVELYGSSGRGFLLVCEPKGSALCIVTVNGVSRRARYQTSRDLPDGFVSDGLKAVRPVGPTARV